jgi:hypothetical protein
MKVWFPSNWKNQQIFFQCRRLRFFSSPLVKFTKNHGRMTTILYNTISYMTSLLVTMTLDSISVCNRQLVMEACFLCGMPWCGPKFWLFTWRSQMYCNVAWGGWVHTVHVSFKRLFLVLHGLNETASSCNTFSAPADHAGHFQVRKEVCHHWGNIPYTEYLAACRQQLALIVYYILLGTV